MVIAPFTSCAATGDAFIGRQGLVKNLRGRIARGESLAVLGGPKLGKTSLIRTALQGLTDQAVIEIDCSADGFSSIDLSPGSIVALDNFDSVADSAIGVLLARVTAARPAGILVTGGRRLRTILGDSGTLADIPFRLFPLSVLLDGEAQRLIGQDTNADLAAWTGNHPFMIKLLLHYMDREGNENHQPLEQAVAMARPQWEPFIQRLAGEIGEGPERQLLCYLIESGKPVNPTMAQSDTGIQNIKAVADTLVYLGAISRGIRNDEATLLAGCRLLNDFITGASKNSCQAFS